MASKQKQKTGSLTSKDIKESLDELEKRIDRAKVLYEQYFMGIQKTAPMQLQTDLERRIREMTRVRLPSSRARYRFASISQRFASYNTYWKRTMRQIENGTYIKHIAKVGRDAIRNGKDVPDEILNKMPKRMRERILRDRENAGKIHARKEQKVRQDKADGKVLDNKRKNVHSLNTADLEDVDYQSLFDQMVGGDELKSVAVVSTPKPEIKAKPSSAKATPPKRTPKPPVRTQVKLPPGMGERESKELYQKYIKARKLVGEKVEGITYSKLMRSLNNQAPKVLNKHAGKGVAWNVEVKGEKVILKAKPKK